MFEFVLIFKLIIYFFSTIPLLLLCISKKKTAPPPLLPRHPRNEDSENDTINNITECTVMYKEISVKPEVPEKKEVSKVEVKKSPRHSSEVSINTGFDLDKGEKTSTPSVVV